MERIMHFQDELGQRAQKAEDIIFHYLPEEEGDLSGAMCYAMKAGGKRLRPVLMEEIYRMTGGEEEVIGPFMAGIEMIHTHSLIHDDLPALDNDDYRRGRLSTHKVYGEAMGILAGDALLNYAYETMLKGFDLTEFPARAARAARIIADKTGRRGMLFGQSEDVKNEGRPLEKEELFRIYHNKTGALLAASMMAGAVLSGCTDETVGVMENAGYDIGMAFQIRDDILDVTAVPEELGKPVHSDEKNHKTTSVTLLGLNGAASLAEEIQERAVRAVSGFPGSEFLVELIRYLTCRTA